MNIETGLRYPMSIEELLSVLPGENKEIYEDDAEELMELLNQQDAWKPGGAWKELTVTKTDGKTVELDHIGLKSPYLAEMLKEGDRIAGAVITAGKELHQLLSDCDDIMQEYILGFWMSHILTVKAVDIVEALWQKNRKPHVRMIMPGMPEICPLDQQIQISAMLQEEFKALDVTVSPGGTLSPTYSMTAFFLFSEDAANIPDDWEDAAARAELGRSLNRGAGHY